MGSLTRRLDYPDLVAGTVLVEAELGEGSAQVADVGEARSTGDRRERAVRGRGAGGHRRLGADPQDADVRALTEDRLESPLELPP